MKLNQCWIAARIPHQGRMCLLDAVEQWNRDQIICSASSHRQADHPLRAHGRLGISAGIEYAAQAMAVHGALLCGDDETPAAGFLTSVREVQWQRARLDDVATDLCVRAERISGNGTTLLYGFSLHAQGAMLLRGRASVLLKAPDGPATP
jgi:predicted hotdog family 3-hydroxylacyl-ACP dehydratase